MMRGAARCLLPAMVVAAWVSGSQGRSVVVPAADAAVITNPESVSETRSLMRFEMPVELAGAEVEYAVVEFTGSVSSSDAAGVLTLDAFLVTAEWDSDTVEWADGWSAAGGDFDAEVHAVWTAVSGESSVVRFDATEMVAAWVSGERWNYGLIVRSAPGEAGTMEPTGAAGGRGSPMLRIWYTGPARRGRG